MSDTSPRMPGTDLNWTSPSMTWDAADDAQLPENTVFLVFLTVLSFLALPPNLLLLSVTMRRIPHPLSYSPACCRCCPKRGGGLKSFSMSTRATRKSMKNSSTAAGVPLHGPERSLGIPVFLISQTFSNVLICLTSPLDILFLLHDRGQRELTLGSLPLGLSGDMHCLLFLAVKSVLMIFSIIIVSLQGIDKVYKVHYIGRPYLKVKARLKLVAVFLTALVSAVPLTSQLVLTGARPLAGGCHVLPAVVDVTEAIFFIACAVSVASLVVVIVLLRRHSRKVSSGGAADVTCKDVREAKAARSGLFNSKVFYVSVHFDEVSVASHSHQERHNELSDTERTASPRHTHRKGVRSGPKRCLTCLPLLRSSSWSSTDSVKMSATSSTAGCVSSGLALRSAVVLGPEVSENKGRELVPRQPLHPRGGDNVQSREDSAFSVTTLSLHSTGNVAAGDGEQVARGQEKDEETVRVERNNIHCPEVGTEKCSLLNDPAISNIPGQPLEEVLRSVQLHNVLDGQDNRHKTHMITQPAVQNYPENNQPVVIEIKHETIKTVLVDIAPNQFTDGTAAKDLAPRRNSSLQTLDPSELLNLHRDAHRAGNSHDKTSAADRLQVPNAAFRPSTSSLASASTSSTSVASLSHDSAPKLAEAAAEAGSAEEDDQRLTADGQCRQCRAGQREQGAGDTGQTLQSNGAAVGGRPVLLGLGRPWDGSGPRGAAESGLLPSTAASASVAALGSAAAAATTAGDTDFKMQPSPSLREEHWKKRKTYSRISFAKSCRTPDHRQDQPHDHLHHHHHDHHQDHSVTHEAGRECARCNNARCHEAHGRSTATLRRLRSATVTAARRGILMLGVFLLCYLPLMAILLVLSTHHPVYRTALLLEGLTLPIGYIHALLAPLLTMRLDPEWRRPAALLLRRCCCACRGLWASPRPPELAES